MSKTALITGVNGQDGSYLAELLIARGYEVHGLIRRASTFNRARIEHLHHFEAPGQEGLRLYYGDITDSASLRSIIQAVQPDEIYHLAAQSHVGVSFEIPEYTADSVGLGTLKLLEAIRTSSVANTVRIYNAATSELFGGQDECAYSEESPFYPRSPYGVAKLYAYWIGVNYREAFDLWVSTGILFNHESPRRGENFVTRKISIAVAQIATGKLEVLRLGNLAARRDWGYAPDYVDAMWRMLQTPEPEDFVIATGVSHSVRDFAELAFREIGVTISWSGEGLDEVGMDAETGRVYVRVAPEYFRPTEVDTLLGDASRARERLDWVPRVSFEELVRLMVQEDLKREGMSAVEEALG